MDNCYQCDQPADLQCPECGTTVCSGHLEPRYTGPDRGFESRYMCPSCWKDKKVTLDSQMERVCRS